MKHLHVIHNDKFTDDFILFIKKNYDFKKHFFIIEGKKNKSNNEMSTLEFDNIIKLNTLRNFKSLLIFEKNIYGAEKIHFHGLFNRDIFKLLYLQPWLLKDSNWIIWGGDLYSYRRSKNNWKNKLNEFVRKKVIKNFSEITSFIPGDYEVAKKIYNTKAEYNYAITYNVFAEPSYYDNLINKNNIQKNDNTIFQVGNSADPRNNHIEILKLLEPYKNKNIKIIVPLSYGNEKHKEKVINYGENIFGKKFKPLNEFYELKEYLKVLNKVDVGIFNHKRQQGLGNMTKLLRLGKKVYLRSDVSSWNYFKDIGAKVYDTKKIDNICFDEIVYYPQEIAKKNINIIKKIMSEEYRAKLWKEILKN